MKMFRTSILTIMLLGLVVASCKKDKDDPTTPVKKVMAEFPFVGEGHESVYVMTLFTVTDTSTTMRTSPISETEWMTIYGNPVLGYDTSVVFADGDYLMSYDLGGSPANAVKLMKANAQVGENWLADTITNVVTGTDVSLDVEAGNFLCVELAQITPSNDTSFIYYNINDGIIKQSLDAVVLVVDLELYSKNF